MVWAQLPAYFSRCSWNLCLVGVAGVGVLMANVVSQDRVCAVG